MKDKMAKLKSRLSEFSISFSDFEAHLKEMDSSISLAYMSSFDNLGGKSSDIDVYIIGSKKPELLLKEKNTHFVGMFTIGELLIDLEFWPEDYIRKLLKEDYTKLEEEELKLLQKLSAAVIITNTCEGSELINAIDKAKLGEVVKKIYREKANSYLDDGIKLLGDCYEELALICAREALQFTIGEINASKGKINLKYKWIMRIFEDNGGYGNVDNVVKYKTYMLDIPDRGCSLRPYVEEIIDFISMLRTREIGLFSDMF